MPNDQRLYTVEDPWRNNEPNRSCIPEGEYACSPRYYNRGQYDAIHVTNVPGREFILFHRGNTEDDIAGCIAPGMKLGFVVNRWAVSNSGDAFKILMQNFGDLHFELEISHFDPEEMQYNTRGASTKSEVQVKLATPDIGFLHRFGVEIFINPNQLPDNYRVIKH